MKIKPRIPLLCGKDSKGYGASCQGWSLVGLQPQKHMSIWCLLSLQKEGQAAALPQEAPALWLHKAEPHKAVTNGQQEEELSIGPCKANVGLDLLLGWGLSRQSTEFLRTAAGSHQYHNFFYIKNQVHLARRKSKELSGL